MVVMKKRRYQLSSISVIAGDKCTNSLCRHQHRANKGSQTSPECGVVLQGESLARHVMQEHGGHQPDGAMNGQLAAVTAGCSI